MIIWYFYDLIILCNWFYQRKSMWVENKSLSSFFSNYTCFSRSSGFEIFFADVNSIENSMKNCYHFSIKPVLYIFCLLHLLICGSSAFRCQLTNKQEITKKNKKSWEGLWYVVLMICGGLRLFINKKFWELLKLWSQ